MKRGNTYTQRSSVGAKCCSVVDVITDSARRRRARTKPQPWIVRKSMVGVTSAMIAYSLYVFVVRLCVDMIERKEHAGGSRGAGIALLIVFSILWLWVVWAYVKIVVTSPGYAKDHVSKSDRPMFPEPSTPFTPYDHIIENSTYRTLHSDGFSHDLDQENLAGPSYENIPARQPPKSSKPVADNSTASEEKTEEDSKNGLPRKPELVYKRQKDPGDYLHRRPPTTPILRPEHRYCGIDGIVKPYRTHHCRNCGTCILKYDHHCPWIGQCVGARNQKFFFNFIQAGSVYTIYICVTLLVFVVLRASTDGHIDPQRIVVIALAALFGMFTTVMQCTHFRLIWIGQTTVEGIQAHRMRHREKQAMNDVIGCWAIIAKRRKARSYDEEWGRIDCEGNIWWLGSGKKGWVDVMGHGVCGWFLPIGKSLNDGLTYPVNPRFDAQGIWRKRADWPEELR